MVTFKSTTLLEQGLRVEVISGKHKFILDEPVGLGGTDLGMNPVEVLLGALGACKCIVARSFAQAHNIDLQDIRIDLEGKLDPKGYMGIKKDSKIGFSEIKSKVFIKSSSSDEDIVKFVEFIEKNCPVYDTIINAPEMITEITIER